jgi:hypothetical protein
MDLITRTVYALIRFPDTMASGESHALIEDVVNSTMPYAICKCPGDSPEARSLRKSEACALHEPEGCPAVPMFTRGRRVRAAVGSEDEAQRAVRKCVQSRPMHSPAVYLGLCKSWPRILFENPDLEAVSRSVGLGGSGVGLCVFGGHDWVAGDS